MISRVGRREQRGLNEKEMQVNLCTCFLFLYLMNTIYSPNDF